MDLNKDKYSITDLKALMDRLRNPDNGCPWDIEQDFQSIKPHTIEEAYEVADAIERQNHDDLKDELGDLLFQVLFHAQMAKEVNLFTFDDIVDHVTKKMIFRHPHVFGNDEANDASTVKDTIWEQQKEKEQLLKGDGNSHYLDSLTLALPSLLLTHKLQKKIRKVGFRYNDIEDVFHKIDEEISELKQSIKDGCSQAVEEEFGDILFTVALLVHHLETEKTPEEILRKTCLKVIARFNGTEDRLKNDGLSLEQVEIKEMLAAWETVKHNQKLF